MLSKALPTHKQILEETLPTTITKGFDHLSIFGCGDSYFAGIASQWFFESVAQLPTNIRTALQFSRYTDNAICRQQYQSPVAIGISVSGTSTRTKEAMLNAQYGGIPTIALTANHGEFSQMANYSLVTEESKFTDPEPNGTPGIRTFYSNFLLLMLFAVQIAEKKQTLDKDQKQKFNATFENLPTTLESLINKNTHSIQAIQSDWADADKYVFVGAGPNYGSALFSAAKIIEASGDFAIAQETEEWAHLNYYNSEKNTPTFFLSNGENDFSRIKEVLEAARSIGRRTALISPYTKSELKGICDFALTIPKSPHDCFSVFYICVLTSMFAAYRANSLNSTYFRDNNTVEISRIRSSEQELPTH